MAEESTGEAFMRLVRLAGRLDDTLANPLWAEDSKPVGALRHWVLANTMPGLAVPWSGDPPDWWLEDGWVTIITGGHAHTLVPVGEDDWWTPQGALRLWERAAQVGHRIVSAGGLNPYWSQWWIDGGRLTVTAAVDEHTRVTACTPLTRMGYPLMLRLLTLRARKPGTPAGDRLMTALQNAREEH